MELKVIVRLTAPAPVTQDEMEHKLMERAAQLYPTYRPCWDGTPEELTPYLFNAGEVIRFTRDGNLVPLMGAIKYKQAWLIHDQHHGRPPYKITTKVLRKYMETFYLNWVAVA